MSRLDFNQVLPDVHDDANNALQVTPSPTGSPFPVTIAGGSIVTDEYDEIDLTYVAAGNGVGEIQTVTYKLAGATVALLTLTYNSDNKLTQVLKS